MDAEPAKESPAVALPIPLGDPEGGNGEDQGAVDDHDRDDPGRAIHNRLPTVRLPARICVRTF